MTRTLSAIVPMALLCAIASPVWLDVRSWVGSVYPEVYQTWIGAGMTPVGRPASRKGGR